MIAEQARMYCKRAYDLPFLIDMIGPHIPVLLLERTRMQDQACRAVIGACTHFVAHKKLTAATPGAQRFPSIVRCVCCVAVVT
jgi:hypothetical protein